MDEAREVAKGHTEEERRGKDRKTGQEKKKEKEKEKKK